MITALSVEWLKFRRSPMPKVATVLVGVLTPLMAVGLVTLARSDLLSGPSRDKFAVALIGTPSEAHLALENQVLAVAMVLCGGLVAAWLFGREFVEGTLGSLFGLPVSRGTIGLAKASIAAAWSVSVAAFATLATLLVSWALSPATMDGHIVRHALTVFGAGAIMGLLGLPFGWLAILTRGYMGPFTGLILVTAFGQMAAAIGWGYWVPYVVPALWAGAGGAAAAALVTPWELAFARAFAVAGGVVTVAAFRRVRIS
jgi:ABC-type transport system involved in multi-copper enzyme maturation permease subunit